jgi:two-component system NtrC family sensor kinase
MSADSADLISKLRATLGKMEVALGAIVEAIAWTDTQGKVQWSNTTFDSLVGRHRFAILGAKITELLPLEQHQEKVDDSLHPVNLALNSQRQGNGIYEFHQVHQTLVLEISWARIELEKGENCAVIAIHDITKHQQEEAELLQHREHLKDLVEAKTAELQAASEKLQREITEHQRAENALKLYQLLAEQARDIVLFIRQDGTLIEANSAAVLTYGYHREQLLSLKIQDLRDSQTDVVFTETLSDTNQQGILFETIHRRKDGSSFPVEVSMQSTLIGEERVFLNIIRDITKWKQAELALRKSEAAATLQAQQLTETLSQLQQTESQLIHTEKMSSLGLLVAGIAHEINNPVNFIYGNLNYINKYAKNLLTLIKLYQQNPPRTEAFIQEFIEEIDLDFMEEDLPKVLASVQVGAERIREIVLTLRNFSRLDEAEMKPVNIHEGIDSTLLILQHRLKANSDFLGIQIIKEYGDLPLVECYAGQLNQVFMNILSNAIDALNSYNPLTANKLAFKDSQDNRNQITISTQVINSDWVKVKIADNGPGIPEDVQKKLFDPFFTTKPVGKGTGLGLSISYQIIVDKHKGLLRCESSHGKGTAFMIEIPIRQSAIKS